MDLYILLSGRVGISKGAFPRFPKEGKRGYQLLSVLDEGARADQ
jgi:hypothetical protein